jgi:hypothetical protein
MASGSRPQLAAPPPFSQQGARSWLILAALAVSLVVTGTTCLLVPVPTYVPATATVGGDSAPCAAQGLDTLEGGCVVVTVDGAWAGRIPPGAEATLQVTGRPDVERVELARVTGTRPVLGVARTDAPEAERRDATATVAVGSRSLALVLLGRGLEARP